MPILASDLCRAAWGGPSVDVRNSSPVQIQMADCGDRSVVKMRLRYTPERRGVCCPGTA